jgi:hypothetical protein
LSKPLPKLPLSSSNLGANLKIKDRSEDRGSALAEFALLALPLCLISIAAINYGLNVYIDTSLRSAALATARFGSLADTTLSQGQQFAQQICAEAPFGVNAVCQLDYREASRPTAIAEVTYQPLSLIFYQPDVVVIRASIALEIDKR